ncbi:MAG: hypothetical protein P1T08_08840 [Acidimicrobiia bacterium]|nr:hypothetical protein [Acidimicrobiia bacterium]
MPPVQPQPVDPTEILNKRRIGAAFAALTNSDDCHSDVSLQLDEEERRSIAHVLNDNSHPLGGFAQTVLDQWDQLDADDRVAGLLLFAEIVNRPHRQRTVAQGMER